MKKLNKKNRKLKKELKQKVKGGIIVSTGGEAPVLREKNVDKKLSNGQVKDALGYSQVTPEIKRQEAQRKKNLSASLAVDTSFGAACIAETEKRIVENLLLGKEATQTEADLQVEIAEKALEDTQVSAIEIKDVLDTLDTNFELMMPDGTISLRVLKLLYENQKLKKIQGNRKRAQAISEKTNGYIESMDAQRMMLIRKAFKCLSALSISNNRLREIEPILKVYEYHHMKVDSVDKMQKFDQKLMTLLGNLDSTPATKKRLKKDKTDEQLLLKSKKKKNETMKEEFEKGFKLKMDEVFPGLKSSCEVSSYESVSQLVFNSTEIYDEDGSLNKETFRKLWLSQIGELYDVDTGHVRMNKEDENEDEADEFNRIFDDVFDPTYFESKKKELLKKYKGLIKITDKNELLLKDALIPTLKEKNKLNASTVAQLNRLISENEDNLKAFSSMSKYEQYEIDHNQTVAAMCLGSALAGVVYAADLLMYKVSEYEAEVHSHQKDFLNDRCQLAQELLTDNEFSGLKADIGKFKRLGQKTLELKVKKDKSRAKIYGSFWVSGITVTATTGPLGATINKAAKALAIGVEEVTTMREIKLKIVEALGNETGITENMLYAKLKKEYNKAKNEIQKEKIIEIANQLFGLTGDQFKQIVKTELVEKRSLKLIGYKPLPKHSTELESNKAQVNSIMTATETDLYQFMYTLNEYSQMSTELYALVMNRKLF